MVSHDYYLNFRVIRYIFAFYSVGRRQESVVSSQESGVRRLFLFILPTPYTLHPTPQSPR
ncbi:hypothetical protein MiAbW_02554 [Microcystis aeruginosa NIES-4325]|uniref:Uncharacterized protein n=1 Tax=Microcystis aeruginosa NIES-4325 TaxID=2569534 RepID=A0A5J4FAE2_MICAE|nr:hypothetical protein MiAbW_02554 [Microcystis aeruginosa NIES-4325]